MATSPASTKPLVLPKNLTSTVKSRNIESNTVKGSVIPGQERIWGTRDPRALRTQGQLTEAIRILAKENGNLSTAVFNMVQIADSGWKVAAYNPSTAEFSEEGTRLAINLIASMDTLHDYTKGYGSKRPIGMLVQTLLRETVLTSGVGIELVLDRNRYPDRFQAVDYSTLKWVSDGKGGKYPRQEGFDEIVDLNIPTFYAESLHQEMNTAYGTSLLRASLDSLFASTEFVADMRRVLFKSGHSRLVASLDAEKIAATAPDDVRNDKDKLIAFMTQVKTDVENTLKDIAPEDAVVSFDSVSFDTQDIGKTKSDYTGLLSALNNQEATALKTPPSILGMRSSGSQSLSNSETLIFLKAAASIQTPVQTVMSRALTTAVRLFGSDVYVKLKFNPINLRPESELEAFYTMRETRILNRLSLGLITDAQMAYELGIPYNPDAPKLSGTGFMTATASNQGTETTRGAMEDTLQPDEDVPRNGGGRDQ